MARTYHLKGSRLREKTLRQQSAAEVKAGRPALIVAGERRGK